MKNVNEILKRQLLLMKFDSGVTLKENYEKVSGKRILNETKADNVKNILDGCYADGRNNNEGRMVDDDMIYSVIGKYDEAFRDYVGTNLDPFRKANSDVMNKFSYSDLCRVNDWYPSTAGESFYEAIDGDIDYDDEWQEILDAFNAAKGRTGPAPAPAPVVDNTKKDDTVKDGEEAAKPESGDKYLIPGSSNKHGYHDFNWFRSAFPCVFKNERVDDYQVYNNGEWDYIRIVAPGEKTIQMYWDGILREEKTLADYMNNGVPSKLSCDGNKIKISGWK